MSTYRPNDTKNKLKWRKHTYRQWKKHQSVIQTISGISNGWSKRRNAVWAWKKSSSDFKWRLKVEATAMPLSWRGGLFQASGPDTENERWPNPDWDLPLPFLNPCSLRTKKYCSFINFGLHHYQPKSNSQPLHSAHPFHCTNVMYVVCFDFYCFYVLFHLHFICYSALGPQVCY